MVLTKGIAKERLAIRGLPLHIVFICPIIVYSSYVAVTCQGLPWWAEPFAVGLGSLLIDIPFDIMGVKLLWWTWHDTDPNIFDKHYSVPWASYMFHLSTASTFTFFINSGSQTLSQDLRPQLTRKERPLNCTVAARVRPSLSRTIQEMKKCRRAKNIIFFLTQKGNILHDKRNSKARTENNHRKLQISIIGIHQGDALFVFIVWTADRNNPRKSKENATRGWWLKHEIGQGVLLHFLFLALLVIYSQPEHQVSIGLHEIAGPCNQTKAITSALGVVEYRRAYLCTEDYDKAMFDWHCVPGAKPPSHGTDWYTICGTPFPNHMEYIYTVIASCLLSLAVYRIALNGRTQHVKGIKSD
ncbi:uncharacterized protein LOC103182226 [Callorhinchus milii]|uniref:uncharacterized protein LOC103182226 n=1 Tax=Callorhinchus milii TaxID=7868 RepID=UPI001C3FEC83|nr:uncharacterized protein LOC103182226 [Callorhinchus milii]